MERAPNMKLPLAIAAASVLLSACAGSAPPPRGGGRLALDVAPLSLPGVTEATYAFTVKNAAGETVWAAGPLASTRYGDGAGALSYVGTCDAAGGLHRVELTLVSLTVAGEGTLESPRDYANPTQAADGSPAPIALTGVPCSADADTPVRFDLTVMRAARQGFFDFAVTFDDIFCSAKVDCRPALLHDADGERGPTAVLAFACAAGVGEETHLYLSDLALTCTDGGGSTVQTLGVAAAGPGQHGPQGPYIFQWAVYRGQEFLAQANLEKFYWNHALGLDLAAIGARTCVLSATGAASRAPLEVSGGAYVLPQTGSYPFISYAVEVVGPGGALCENQALNGPEGTVKTEYVVTSTPPAEVPRFAATVPVPPLACATGAGSVSVAPAGAGFVLSTADGSVPTASFQLPAGYAIGAACCTPGCCQP